MLSGKFEILRSHRAETGGEGLEGRRQGGSETSSHPQLGKKYREGEGPGLGCESYACRGCRHPSSRTLVPKDAVTQSSRQILHEPWGGQAASGSASWGTGNRGQGR